MLVNIQDGIVFLLREISLKMALSRTKITIGTVAILFMVSGGFYLSHKNGKGTPSGVPAASGNIENRMDELVAQKNYSQASERLKEYTNSIGPRNHRIDRYIADFYSAKLTIESMPLISHPMAANQYLTILTSLRNRIEQATMLLAQEKFEENLKIHWAHKFASLSGDVNKKLSEVVTFNRISRKETKGYK